MKSEEIKNMREKAMASCTTFDTMRDFVVQACDTLEDKRSSVMEAYFNLENWLYGEGRNKPIYITVNEAGRNIAFNLTHSLVEHITLMKIANGAEVTLTA